MLFIGVFCNLLDAIGAEIFKFQSVNGLMRHPVYVGKHKDGRKVSKDKGRKEFFRNKPGTFSLI